MKRRWPLLVVITTLAMTMVVPAAGAEPTLVLPSTSLPGLHRVAASWIAAHRDLAAGLRHSLVAEIAAAQLRTSSAAGHGTYLRSDAFVFASTAGARDVLAGWRRAHHGAPVAVGTGGYVYRKRARGAISVVIAWRLRERLGVIVLTGKRGSARLAARARQYAILANTWLGAPLPKTAWGKVLDQIQPNGRWSLRGALQAFAVSYGPLPGVKPPGGAAARIPSGTAAALSILSYRRRLTVAQRAAVEHRLGVAIGGAHAAQAATYGDPNFTPDAGIQKIINGFVSAYESKLHHTLGLKVIAGTTTTVVKTKKGIVLADALPLNADGEWGSGVPSICRVRVTAAGLAASPEFRQLFLAHELFHCFQFDIRSPDWSPLPEWIGEGTADWAALSIDPVSYAVGGGNLTSYIGSPHTPIFERSYDAVGFWGHVQDVEGDLWKTLPAIFKDGRNLQSFALAGAGDNAFLTSWASSLLRYPGGLGGPPWHMQSPIEPPPLSALATPADTIVGDGVASAAPGTIANYIVLAKPGAPLLHIATQGYGRLSPVANYVQPSDLKEAWFCTDPKGCTCPPNTTGEIPSHHPLSPKSLLALAGDPSDVAGSFADLTSYSLDTFCQPKERPTPYHYGNAGSGGDPHTTTFDGAFYDFQAAGEFTLVKSTHDNLEIQVRQQPYHGPIADEPVAVITAIAVRVGHSIVQEDADGKLWLDKHRLRRAGEVNLGGGAFLRGARPNDAAPTVFWSDGTYATMYPGFGVGMDIVVHAARDRAGHLRGLLGPYSGKRDRDFIGRNGKHYAATKLGGPPFGVLYGQFGNSWRITQRQSLFRYPRGKSTRSYARINYPPRAVSVSSLSPKARARGEKICKRAGIKSPALLKDCILDVGATGDAGFAKHDKHLQGAVRGHAPPVSPGALPWKKLSTLGDVVVPLTVGRVGGQVVAAYRSADLDSIVAATFTPGGDGVSGVSARMPYAHWETLADPVLLPRQGGLQMILSGTHSPTSTDPLNGTTLVARAPDGSFGPPTRLSATNNCCVSSAVLAADGKTPIWLSDALGQTLIYRGSHEQDLTGDSPVAPSSQRLVRDNRGRLWLTWFGGIEGVDPEHRVGLYMMQLNPQTGAPLAKPVHVPDSGEGSEYTVACAAVCRLVFIQSSSHAIVTWAPGDKRVVRAFSGIGARGITEVVGALTAAYTTGRRLWVNWFDAETGYEYAKLGDAGGAGGRILRLRKPPGSRVTAEDEPGSSAASPDGDRLVLVSQWLHSRPGHTTQSKVWTTVVNPP